MKILQYLKGFLVVALLGIFVAANWAPHTPDEDIKPVRVVAFDLKSDQDVQPVAQIEKALSKRHGITAVSLNASAKLLGLTYHEDEASMAQIQGYLAEAGLKNAQLHRFAESKSACPIPHTQILAVWQSFFQFLRIR